MNSKAQNNMAAKLRILEREAKKTNFTSQMVSGASDAYKMKVLEVNFEDVRKEEGTWMKEKSEEPKMDETFSGSTTVISREKLKMEFDEKNKLFEQFQLSTEKQLEVAAAALGQASQQISTMMNCFSRIWDSVKANEAAICQVKEGLDGLQKLGKNQTCSEERMKAMANDIWKSKTNVFFSQVEAKIDKVLRQACDEMMMQFCREDTESSGEEDYWTSKGKAGLKGKSKGHGNDLDGDLDELEDFYMKSGSGKGKSQRKQAHGKR